MSHFLLFSCHHAQPSRWHLAPPWSYPASPSRQSSLLQLSLGSSMVSTFTLLDLVQVLKKRKKKSLSFLFFLNWKFCLCCCAGQNISARVPGSTQIKNGGLYLSISHVTPAHGGEYTCLVKGDTTEILRTYRVRVDGEKKICKQKQGNMNLYKY